MGNNTAARNYSTISLPAATLRRYAGKYKGPQSGVLKITADKGLLVMNTNDHDFLLYPEKENLFFSKERDLTFEFTKDKLIVRERGAVAEELTLEK